MIIEPPRLPDREPWMSEPRYESIILAAAEFEREADDRDNFCRICWMSMTECPGHVGYMEMFGPPPTQDEVDAYRVDLEVRQRGLQRKSESLNATAINLGYDGIDDLMEKTR